MNWPALVIISLGLALALAMHFVERSRLRKLLDRPCAGIRWVRQFPDVSRTEIRTFLHRFAEAFAIEKFHACKFGPTDRPLAIYEARYVPHLTLDDHGEWESLAEMLTTHYSISLQTVWREDLSLGELFTLARCGNGSH